MRSKENITSIILLTLAVIIIIFVTLFIVVAIRDDKGGDFSNSNQEDVVVETEIDYNNFYTLESIMKKIMKYIVNESYDTVYKLLDKESEISKSDFYNIIKEYNDAMITYRDVKYLVQANRVSDDVYLCEFEIAGYRQTIKIKINEEKSTFTILDLDKWGYVDD